MCDPVTIMTLVSTVGSLAAGAHTARKQDRATADGILRQAALSRKADDQVGQNIRQLEKSTPEPDRAAANSDFLAALREASAQDGANFGTPGATSARFGQASDVVRKTVGNDSAAMAGRLARIDAPVNQRVRESQGRADTASRLSMLDRDSQAQDFLTRLKTASIQTNPWITAATELGSSAAASMAKAPPKVKKPKPSAGNIMDPVTSGFGDGVRVA